MRGTEKKLLIEAALTIIAVRVALMTIPFAVVARWIKGSGVADSLRAPSRSVSTIDWAVHATSRRIPGSSCLCCALTAQRLLRAAGIESNLRLGVAKNEQQFQAHAWLENASGVIFGSDQQTSYAPLPKLEFETR